MQFNEHILKLKESYVTLSEIKSDTKFQFNSESKTDDEKEKGSETLHHAMIKRDLEKFEDNTSTADKDIETNSNGSPYDTDYDQLDIDYDQPDSNYEDNINMKESKSIIDNESPYDTEYDQLDSNYEDDINMKESESILNRETEIPRSEIQSRYSECSSTITSNIITTTATTYKYSPPGTSQYIYKHTSSFMSYISPPHGGKARPKPNPRPTSGSLGYESFKNLTKLNVLATFTTILIANILFYL